MTFLIHNKIFNSSALDIGYPNCWGLMFSQNTKLPDSICFTNDILIPFMS